MNYAIRMARQEVDDTTSSGMDNATKSPRSIKKPCPTRATVSMIQFLILLLPPSERTSIPRDSWKVMKQWQPKQSKPTQQVIKMQVKLIRL
ncbi:uncharacterized protein IUM83_19965 [Phytophthora cinnamomi]|uniref:uncharacterized protein n=1 Tax=Phytophthora cinnamomi TaxID=4785 RepID=UPI00355AAAAE|nr:hypothetical protein IUM83_19965 [Phytophthora cinnamomi]